MKNLNAYIVGLILVAVSALPFIDIQVIAPGQWFPWIFFGAAMAGFFTLFIRTAWIIKAVAIGGLVNCFLSVGPLISFIAYFQLIFCCYFFIICERITNYTPIYKILQTLLFLNVFLLIMKIIGRDPLMNFSESTYFGTVGQHMQMGSFAVVLSACLLNMSGFNLAFPFLASAICDSAGTFISAGIGLATYIQPKWNPKIFIEVLLLIFLVFSIWMVVGSKFTENTSMKSGRIGAWVRTVKLTADHPIKGYGIGTYKVLFPPLSKMIAFPWKTTHNCWLEIFFETGIIGLSLAIAYFVYLVSGLTRLIRRAIFKKKATACLAGLMMIAVNMMLHFPTRQITTVLLIVFFLAVCQKVVDSGRNQNCHC